MKRVLGILRGFPGLGRVVSGVSILETLRDNYNFDIEIISYLQGNRYLESLGYSGFQEAIPMDYCSIGLLPTNKMGVYIHNKIKIFKPDLVIIDGEPLILQSLRISCPNLKIVTILNPSDVDNPQNDKEAMDYFNHMYSLSDLAVVHGLRISTSSYKYDNIINIGTILRNDIFHINNNPRNKIYCVLGGGTVNVGHQFTESTIRIAELCQKTASSLSNYEIHIICSSPNIYNAINENFSNTNVILHQKVLDAVEYYSNASLIITRSGRNTLSELAYLGIPTISFVSGCAYRLTEQEQNLKSLKVDNIKIASIDIAPQDMVELCLSTIESGLKSNHFDCGNQKAIDTILSFL